MEIEKAIEILHPDTTFKAITEIEYYGGFKGKEKAMEAINEACVVACECMEKQIAKKPKEKETTEKTHYCCNNCEEIVLTIYRNGRRIGHLPRFCERCGQAFDWSKVN